MNSKIINENELVPYSTSSLPSGPYLVFAPHPDDETLGMGGTIALAATSGIYVYIVFITNGEKGGDPEVRKKESEAACGFLGVKGIFRLNLPDREVGVVGFPRDNVYDILNTVKPSTIFLPSFQEVHPDHRATTDSILSILKNCSADIADSVDIWFYELNRQGEINKLIDISSVLDTKESAIECYSSQIEQLDYKVHALCLNFMRSITLGGQTNYAEAFWCYDSEENRAMTPKEHYLSHIFKFIEPSYKDIEAVQKNRNISDCYSDEKMIRKEKYINNSYSQTIDAVELNKNKEELFNTELRNLRDKVNIQKNSLSTYSNLTRELSKFINEQINEIKILKCENKKYINLTHDFEQKLSDIALSRAHRIASVYIKSIMEIRNFFKNLKNKNLQRFNKNQQISISDYNNDENLNEKKHIDDNQNFANNEFIKECNEYEEPSDTDIKSILITKPEEPILLLYSEEELHKSNFDEHSIYVENKTYGSKRIEPIINNKSISFYIECSKQNLACISLFIASYIRVNPGILVLSMFQYDEDADFKHGCGEYQYRIQYADKYISLNKLLRTSEILSPSIIDNRFIPFRFKPILDSYGKKFYITLSLKEGCRDRYPGLWINLNSKMDSVEKYHKWIDEHESYSLIQQDLILPNNQMDIADIENNIGKNKITIILPILNFINPALYINPTSSEDSHNDSQVHISNYLKTFSNTIESVLNQSYKNWQMIILKISMGNSLDNCESSKFLDGFLDKYKAEDRINIYDYNVDSGFISNCEFLSNIIKNINYIINKSNCSYFMLLKPCTIISNLAFYEYIKVLNQYPDTNFMYSDEDKITKDGIRFEPFFKPDFSPNLLLSCMYIGNVNLYSRGIFEKIGGYDASILSKSADLNLEILDLLNLNLKISFILEAVEYDFILKLSELTQNIYHVPKILFHNYNYEKQTSRLEIEYKAKALKNALKRRKIYTYIVEEKIDKGLTDNSFKVSYNFNQNIVVSIIIPFKDNYDILQTCLNSIIEKTSYKNYEIICVNNQSENKETLIMLENFQHNFLMQQNIHAADSYYKVRFTILNYDKPFNYSAINNYAAEQSNGDVLLFLNSDTEVISPNWLNAMLEHACRSDVGAVGAKLYYVNDTIQHAGIVLGIAGLAGHAFKHVSRFDADFYNGFPCMIRDVSAVTGACMMVRKSLFQDVGGFDEEHFKVSYNDLDLCLKMRQKGYSIIYTPFAELYHYESYSRGYSFDLNATENIKAKWGDTLEKDPFYNPNLTIFKEDWSLE